MILSYGRYDKITNWFVVIAADCYIRPSFLIPYLFVITSLRVDVIIIIITRNVLIFYSYRCVNIVTQRDRLRRYQRQDPRWKSTGARRRSEFQPVSAGRPFSRMKNNHYRRRFMALPTSVSRRPLSQSRIVLDEKIYFAASFPPPLAFRTRRDQYIILVSLLYRPRWYHCFYGDNKCPRRVNGGAHLDIWCPVRYHIRKWVLIKSVSISDLSTNSRLWPFILRYPKSRSNF